MTTFSAASESGPVLLDAQSRAALVRELLLHVEDLFYRRLFCLVIFQAILLVAVTQAWAAGTPGLRTFLCAVGAGATVLLAAPNMLLSFRLNRFILMERRLQLEAAGELSASEEAHPLAGPLISRAIYGWVVPVAALLMWIGLLSASMNLDNGPASPSNPFPPAAAQPS